MAKTEKAQEKPKRETLTSLRADRANQEKEIANLRRQIDARVEETDTYKHLLKDLEDEKRIKESALRSLEQYKKRHRDMETAFFEWQESLRVKEEQSEEKWQDIEAKYSKKALIDALFFRGELVESLKGDLRQQEADYKELQAKFDTLVTVCADLRSQLETLQADIQQTTQKPKETITEPLPEDMKEWHDDALKMLKEAYKLDGQNNSDNKCDRILRILCANATTRDAMRCLLSYVEAAQGVNVDQLEAQAEIIEGLRAEKREAARTARYNKTMSNYKVIEGLIKELDNKKADLDKLQAEYQQATRHNARGAGRKPKLTDDQVQEIQKLRADGMVMMEISKKIGCSVGLVYNILSKNK